MSETRQATDQARQTDPTPGVDQGARATQALVIEEGDDALTQLRQQIEQMKARDAERDREIQERDEQLAAERKAREWAESKRREAETVAATASTTAEQGRRSAEDAQIEAISAGLKTNEQQIMALQAQYEAAFAEGNGKLLAELQVKIGEAAAAKGQLQLGKEQLERQKTEREAEPRTQQDPMAQREAYIATMVPGVQTWLRDTPQGRRFLEDPAYQTTVRQAAAAVEREGFSMHHPKYIEMVEIKAGIRQAPAAPQVEVVTDAGRPQPQTPYQQPAVQPRGREPMLAAPAGGSTLGVAGGAGSPDQIYLSQEEVAQARRDGLTSQQFAEAKRQLIAEGRLFAHGRAPR